MKEIKTFKEREEELIKEGEAKVILHMKCLQKN